MTDGIPFLKMHGAGNDFVVIDNRGGQYAFAEAERKKMADRRIGIGCDQIVLLETSAKADVFMRLYNADGGEVGACGNATRCVGWLLMRETGMDKVSIETKAGVLEAYRAGDMAVRVNMGRPRFGWQEIPLSREVDTLNLPVALGRVAGAVAVSMGNPHAVFFVENVENVPLGGLGPVLEHDLLFPERANIDVAEVESWNCLIVRVWERGTGETLACGTGACAAAVAARLRGLVDAKVTVRLPGGDLLVEWAGNSQASTDDVWMTGPLALSFEGKWNG